MKEIQHDPRIKISAANDIPHPEAVTTTGDGDKETIANSDLARPQHENKMAENVSVRVTEKQTNPSRCTIDPETELTIEKDGDVKGATAYVGQTGERLNRGKCYRKAMKSMYRKFLLIRRKYKAEMSCLRRSDRETSQVLSRVQLALPVLEKEKQALLAELEAIQKQHEEEKRRNHDLLIRLQRLNHQFARIGMPQGSAAIPTVAQPQDRPLPNSDPQRPLATLTQLPTHYQYHHNHRQQEQQQQQQQCSRFCGASHSFKELKTESAHSIRPSLRSTSLPH